MLFRSSSDHSTLFITTDMLLPSGYYVDCARGIWWTQVQRDVKSGCPVTARVPVVVFGAHSIISKKDCKTLKLGLDRVEGRSYVRTQLWIVAWRQMAPSPGTVFARNRISHSTSSTLLWNASLFLRLPIYLLSQFRHHRALRTAQLLEPAHRPVVDPPPSNEARSADGASQLAHAAAHPEPSQPNGKEQSGLINVDVVAAEPAACFTPGARSRGQHGLEQRERLYAPTIVPLVRGTQRRQRGS